MVTDKTSKYLISNSITAKATEVFLLDNSILVIKFFDNDEDIDVDEINIHIFHGRKIFGDKKIPVLVDMRDSFHHITKEAKEHAASNNDKLAEAVLVKHLHQKILATFFIRLTQSKSKHPIQIFNKEEEAIKWLKEFI